MYDKKWKYILVAICVVAHSLWEENLVRLKSYAPAKDLIPVQHVSRHNLKAHNSLKPS
jgi:hypothetical protein